MIKSLIHRMLLASIVACLAIAASGCRNTAEGVGEDMEEMGEDIQREL